jgi:hypothetical protein
MRKRKIYILSFFLLLVFALPIFVQGLHDTFEHDYSHEFHKEAGSSFTNYEYEMCAIHSFKYYSYSFQKIEQPKYISSVFSNIFSAIKNDFWKENIISFYLLRAPPTPFTI